MLQLMETDMLFWIIVGVLATYVSVRNNRINPKVKRVRLIIEGKRDTVFDGRLIADVWWFVGGMALYKTKGGDYVCYRVDCYSGEILHVVSKGRSQKEVENAITGFFGGCDRAKRLYRRARISDAAYVNFIE